MTSDHSQDGVRGRLASKGEDALGKLAQDLLENPLVNGALSRAFDARERASQAQEVAMGALNIPSASDLERLTRRLRSVSQRLEGIEDALDRLGQTVGKGGGAGRADTRLAAIEEQLTALTEMVSELHPESPKPIPRDQERLSVDAS